MDDHADAPPVRYTTSVLAEATGYSVQQIRDLERLGVIPPAARRTNGYRQFSGVHAAALRAYRQLATAVGPVVARSTMAEVRHLSFDEAVGKIVALHVDLACMRDDTIAALRALDGIVDEGTHDAPPLPEDSMTITELSTALGVRSSALRFWEQQGLITPERPDRFSARRYPPDAVRDARIVTALRQGGYRIAAVHAVMASLRTVHGTADARDALNDRLRSIATRSDALLRAGNDISDLLRESAPDRAPDAGSGPGNGQGGG